MEGIKGLVSWYPLVSRGNAVSSRENPGLEKELGTLEIVNG